MGRRGAAVALGAGWLPRSAALLELLALFRFQPAELILDLVPQLLAIEEQVLGIHVQLTGQSVNTLLFWMGQTRLLFDS